MSHNALRAEIYLILSAAFQKPTAEFIAEQGNMIEFLRQSFDKLDYDIPSQLYAAWPQLAGELAALTDAYYQSFVFPVGTRVVPVESVYRQWTYDETIDAPFAKEKGLLMSDHALHMSALQAAYGLAVPMEYHSMPDHIVLELEFAAVLLERGAKKEFRIFLAEHLNWLDELAADSEKQNIPAYYRQLIKLTAEFVARELRR